MGLACALLLCPAFLSAAEEAPTQQELSAGIVPLIENGKRIYTVAQFARFSPQTAADVVAQIPGFSVSNVSNDRGLGEASQNVLINGQRITGKGNDANTVLRRIPVNTIRRLEIMDGAMLDISGLSGHVLNVLTEQAGMQGNFTWRPPYPGTRARPLVSRRSECFGQVGHRRFLAGPALGWFSRWRLGQGSRRPDPAPA